MYKFWLIFVFQGLFLCGQSQTITLTLGECVDYGLKNNTDYINSKFDVDYSNLELSWLKKTKLPTIVSSISQGYQFGRTIDPSTNDYNKYHPHDSLGKSSPMEFAPRRPMYSELAPNTLE